MADLTKENRQTPPKTSLTEPSQPQAVRFASVNQEIEPEHSIQSLSTLTSSTSISNPEFSPEAQEEIRNLSRSLQSSPLQQRRVNHFAFEPVSLPASRVSELLYELVFGRFSRSKHCVPLHCSVSAECVVVESAPRKYEVVSASGFPPKVLHILHQYIF